MLTRLHAFAVASAVLIALAALTAPSPLGAQSFAGTPTFLAIPDVFPDVDGPVVVLRERGRNVILMRASEATPETLSVALGLLRRLTERTPLRPGLSHMAPVTGYHLTTPLGAARYARLDELLTQLTAQPITRIGNLGTFKGGIPAPVPLMVKSSNEFKSPLANCTLHFFYDIDVWPPLLGIPGIYFTIPH